MAFCVASFSWCSFCCARATKKACRVNLSPPAAIVMRKCLWRHAQVFVACFLVFSRVFSGPVCFGGLLWPNSAYFRKFHTVGISIDMQISNAELMQIIPQSSIQVGENYAPNSIGRQETRTCSFHPFPSIHPVYRFRRNHTVY